MKKPIYKKWWFWLIVVLFVLGLGSGGESTEDTTGNNEQEIVADAGDKTVDVTEQDEEKPEEKSMVETFIEGYNAVAPDPIVDVVSVDVTDEKSGHYRTEFRLGAFQDSIAKTGKIGNVIIDIVNCGWDMDELRIYVDGIEPEQAAEIVKFAAPVMDPSVPAEELQDVIDFLNGTKDYHNGYFGELCMTFNEVHGELMLRTD